MMPTWCWLVPALVLTLVWLVYTQRYRLGLFNPLTLA